MSFHISMAALGFSNVTTEPTTIMVESEKANYAICTLQAGVIPQQQLDLNFTEGEEVKFFLEGNGGEVHLTGYLLETPREYEFDEEDELEGLMTSEDEASSSESEQGEEMVMKNMESSDEDSSKEMETVGAVEVELEEKVCIDGEGNGLKDGGSGDSEDNSSSNGEEHVTWQAALTAKSEIYESIAMQWKMKAENQQWLNEKIRAMPCVHATFLPLNWEQPVYSSRAHVFQIDPETKRRWLPVSKQAVTVSFYFDATRNLYRIISVDGSKALVNSVIISSMAFTKTSQKFGQWSDPKANNVYGLGFNSESDLNKFAEKFKEAKSVAGAAAPASGTESGKSESVKSDSIKSDSFPELNGSVIKANSSSRSFSSNGSLEDDTGGSHKSLSNSVDSQLKYENDRLKKALAQSSANAKKWEAELQTLKNNNAKLTAALQESTVNVEKWKEQLNNYREENLRLKKKVVESNESGASSSHAVEQMRKDLEQQIIELTGRLKLKDEELARSSLQNSEIGSYREKNADMTMKLQQLQGENRKLLQSNAHLEQRVKELQSSESKLTELREVEIELKQKISELMSLHKRMATSLQP
eukprot:Seg1564.3 transcript_id=Seg1564.3/GoldUCD/mRNA.D3Y31 product="Homer protein 1" protein_id=Seg1564.3/GoldUCD/D3Y31